MRGRLHWYEIWTHLGSVGWDMNHSFFINIWWSKSSYLSVLTFFFSKSLSMCGWENGLYSTHSTLKVHWQPVINPDLSEPPSKCPEDERLGLELSRRRISLTAFCVSAHRNCLLTRRRHREVWYIDCRDFKLLFPICKRKIGHILISCSTIGCLTHVCKVNMRLRHKS